MSGSNSSAPVSKDGRSDDREALSLTVHSMPTPSLDDKRTLSGRVKMLLVLLVCAAPVVASYFTYFVIRPEGRTNYSELIQPLRPVPADLALTDVQGRAVTPESLTGQWLLVVVAGGACDEGCEKKLWLQRQLRETLGREKQRVDKVWLVHDGVAPRAQTVQAVGGADAATVLSVSEAALGQWLEPAPGRRLEDQGGGADRLRHEFLGVGARSRAAGWVGAAFGVLLLLLFLAGASMV